MIAGVRSVWRSVVERSCEYVIITYQYFVSVEQYAGLYSMVNRMCKDVFLSHCVFCNKLMQHNKILLSYIMSCLGCVSNV